MYLSLWRKATYFEKCKQQSADSNEDRLMIWNTSAMSIWHSINMRRVSSKHPLSSLPNWLKLTDGPFLQTNKHNTLDLCPDQTCQKGIKYTKAKERLRSYCLIFTHFCYKIFSSDKWENERVIIQGSILFIDRARRERGLDFEAWVPWKSKTGYVHTYKESGTA